MYAYLLQVSYIPGNHKADTYLNVQLGNINVSKLGTAVDAHIKPFFEIQVNEINQESHIAMHPDKSSLLLEEIRNDFKS